MTLVDSWKAALSAWWRPAGDADARPAPRSTRAPSLPGVAPDHWIIRALGVYVGLALVFTWPLAWHPRSVLASTQGPGDSYLNLWILGWDLRTLTTHPLDVLTGRVFDANIFYPAAGTLAYSDHLLLQAVVLTPLYLVTRDLTLCYNALLVLSLVACALAMHALVREVTGSEWGALAAGIAWGFAPYHFGHLIHLQLQALYFLPLAFLFLHRVVAHARKRDACLLGVALGLQALASAYYGVIGGVGVACGALALLTSVEHRRWLLVVRRLLVGAVIGAALVAPVALQYWRVQQREGFSRSLYEARQGSATPASYLQAPQVNLMYGRAGPLALQTGPGNGRAPNEQSLFPGVVLVLLAAGGVWAGRQRDRRPTVLAYSVLVVAGYALSLGPGGIRPLYATVYQFVFGFHGIRAPARFAVLVLFGLAGLAGVGLCQIVSRHSRGARVVAFAAVGLLTVEYANAPLPYVTAPQVNTAIGEWLRAAPEPGAVIYLPLTLDPAGNTLVMVQSLEHGRPIVNGYSGERPLFYSALVDTMARFPSAESLRTLHDLPVTFVVSRQAVQIEGTPLVERARFDDGTVYELRWTPEAGAGLEPIESPPLPDPGPAPFAAGEAAVYSVVWMSGPVAVPAGQAILSVEPGKDGARYELHASATTASWVSRFFEADDHFMSSVDERLRPIISEQRLREGRRQVDRRIVFDRARHIVRLQQADGVEISLPVPRDTMDPLSAFYYMRSLPLDRQGDLRIPINDSGRNLVLELHVVAADSIAYLGAQTDALRVEPRLFLSGGRQMPLRMAAWFSRDARRIPLVIELDGVAGAGSVRLELESFSAHGPPQTP